MRKYFVIAILIVLAIPILSAETVYLNDGTVLKGSIKEATQETVTLVTKQGELIIQKSDIDRIDYRDTEEDLPDNDVQEDQVILDQSFFTNPLSMLLSVVFFNTIDINIGTNWAINNYLILEIIDYFDFFLSSGVFATEVQLAAYINPLGKYLNGPYFGIVGAFTTFSTYLLPSAFSIMAKGGFQWAFNSGVFVGSYLGYAYTFDPYWFGSLKYGIQVGYAYNSQLMKKLFSPNKK